MQFSQVVCGHNRWRALEQRACSGRLWECDDIPQRRCAREQHRRPVEPECNAAVRRMLIDAGLAIGATVGISVATGGLGTGVAIWLAAMGAAAEINDRLDVDRICGPGSPYYNPPTYQH